ncbi:MAG TPA: glycerophosphodiester phosphodiesterase [Candidatus Dormibacteraeota bacterium]|nr:glycerophosphodiester phosphodiesterase [Candidatus Dormibacteraeota bacterium]
MSAATYLARPRPRVFGHRGAAGVAPENTLPSFALAAALGATYLELDVHATSDGEIVVLHDPLLDRTTNGAGPVREWRWADVAALDAGWHFTHDGHSHPYRGQGVRVPRLAEVVAAHPAHPLNIEIKQAEPPIVAATLDVLRRGAALERTLLAAEHDEIMTAIRAAVGDEVATGMSVGDVLAFMDRWMRDDWTGYTAPGTALQVPPAHGEIDIVTATSVAAAHRVGLEVHVWTINEVAEIDRLLDLGVDGVMSDLPGLVATAVARRAGR